MSNKVLITRNKIDVLADSISVKSGIPTPMTLAEMKNAVDSISIGGSGGSAVIQSLSVITNGTYIASNGVDGYSPVTVNVPQPSGTKTINIVSNGTTIENVTNYENAEITVSIPSPTFQTKTVIPTESQQVIIPDTGYDGLSSITVSAIDNEYVGTAITRRSSTDLTSSGAVVTVPSGYYSEQASKTIASGTAGTPTATKGTVSNHSVSVTPSVTNTTGYISGGTKTGTAITVTAAELDSGTKTILENSSDIDVIGYASVNVNIPTGTARTSSDLTVSGATVTVPAGLYSEQATKSVASGTAGTPSATKGTVSNHSMSVTPSVTNTTGYITGGTKTGTAVTVTASELDSGTKTISENGTGIDVVGYASVNVSVPSEAPTLQTKSATYTPTESQQTDTITADNGYDGLDEVNITVNAISSTYVGTGITRRSSSDLTTSGATVTVPSGYYSTQASKSITSGSATTPATTITANPSISVSASGLITATTSTSQNVTPTVSAGYISSGTSGKITVSGSKTEQLTTKAATTYNTSATNQTIASGQYLTGTQTIRGVTYSGLSAGNIASGVTVKIGDSADDDRIASVTGTLQFVTYYTGTSTPSSSQGQNGDIYLKVVN